MKNLPLVSICIPTFNGEKYILEALESAIAQTYKNLEIIISDDASTDNTLKCIKKIKQKTDIPIHIYHHRPSGIGANWNNCIKHAKGEFIKFLFQDDLLFSTCIEELVMVFLSYPDVGLTACKRKILVEGENPENVNSWIRKYTDLQKGIRCNTPGIYIFSKKNLKDFLFVKNNKIGEPSVVLFKRDLVKEIGYFKEDLIQVLDVEFYYRILKHRQIVVLNKKLAAFRIHPAQATNRNKNQIQEDYERYFRILYKKYFWYLDLKTKKKLLKQYHPIGRLYRYLRS